ncbi:hypothetical protein IAQ61_007939 [Plenodomus lingam]|uniref:Similar to cytochrome P450 n=1 Tax=Leptosphaeria maculans (strain JN3 / isolate v23.1.3 / race Av1-4-5-6-7-8) TaxID=985895 RepID=E4ZZK5_LEPMJ|nr:similar to cytochrome P450 [Plenodomus lingam JN3]KAH9867347.1 hypothetical protein IAQ61_007939 [Plenodomus lingam]CBX97121.1 similar to cytochrome P450 [Plenodomus lingam JN3]
MASTKGLDNTIASTPVIVTAIVFAALYSFYLWLLPKPIPGIPYNPEATRSIFGDIPSMLHHLKTSKTVSDWFKTHNERHNSPIVQLWVGLFRRQWIVIDDFREAQDILMRRTKEFDKPDLIGDIFWGVTPQFHANLVTNEAWRAQRKLVSDLMTPAFLNSVAAPQLHEKFSDMVALWREKMRLAQGRPFSVKHDVYEASLEAIWAAVFGGAEDTATRKSVELLASNKSMQLPGGANEEVVFERVPAEAIFEAVLRLTDSIEETLKSPYPIIRGFLQRYYPSLRKHWRVKDTVMTEQIRLAEERLAKMKDDQEIVITNGVDHVLRREQMAAEKEGRAPMYYSPAIKDDLFGLMIAGHDTTSTTLLWSVKFLTKYPSVQLALRTSLHATFPAARATSRTPSAQEIATSTNHYLDAVLEECIRCSTTSALPARTATRDAVVLGHVIPKGTRVTFVTIHAGVNAPPWPIPDSLRSTSYHKAGGGKTGTWDPDTIAEFDPQRWLVRDQEGKEVFDPMAGPQLQFGAGQRGCYGRKLAYLELRIALVLVIWAFELRAVPEAYDGWGVIDMLTRNPEQAYLRLGEGAK